MRLATLRDGSPDGRLVLVSSDGVAFAPAAGTTLQTALESWGHAAPHLAAITAFSQPLNLALLAALLPRAWQWLDGSAYQRHSDLMDAVLGIIKPKTAMPLMYQGIADKFYGATDDVKFTDEALGIDFEENLA